MNSSVQIMPDSFDFNFSEMDYSNNSKMMSSRRANQPDQIHSGSNTFDNNYFNKTSDRRRTEGDDNERNEVDYTYDDDEDIGYKASGNTNSDFFTCFSEKFK